MSATFEQIKSLVQKGEVRISDHGYDELAMDGIMARDVINGLPHAELLEDYPDFPKGPCILVLGFDSDGKPMHIVWGIPKGFSSPAVVITAYRPDPIRWSTDFKRRVK